MPAVAVGEGGSASARRRVPRTLKITLAYDGTRFVGWQRQTHGESIQRLLEDALARFEGGPVVVHGAGRTDAGVHALGQVASASVTLPHDAGALERGLNAQLPPDVRVLSVEDAPHGFHARFSARGKTYRYLMRTGGIPIPFERTTVWHVPERLDEAAMGRAAAMLCGRHDFAAFRSAGNRVQSTERTLRRSTVSPVADTSPLTVEIRSAGRLLAYEVEGDGFLRHMVRAIVGTLVEVGRGWRAPESVGVLLEPGTPRGNAGATAPAHGLSLIRVDYD